jgi:polyvinyl alcohol dehydrogenase (cytochrome)
MMQFVAMACAAAPAEAPPPPDSAHSLKSVAELDSRKLAVDPETLPGAAVFRDHCAQCHLGQVPKAPQKMFLQMMSGPTIHEALTHGLMAGQARDLKETERVQVAEYLSGAPLSAANDYPKPRMCTGKAARFNEAEVPLQAGWGYNNSRFIDANAARLPAADIGKLSLAWAFEFPGAIRARSQPSIAYGAVYVGSYDGTVYALDLAQGCVRWTFKAGAEVRTGVVPYELKDSAGAKIRRLFFADVIARVYSIDALTGKLAWSAKVDDHPNSTVTATPTIDGNTLYVPISSLEVTTAADPNYECCKFRGAVQALDARDGTVRWKAYAIPQAPAPVKTLPSGKRIFAPSGAPIWNSPMVDTKRGLLYVGTGDNFSSPANDTSDAVLAFRLSDGGLVWSFQANAGDAWNVGCMIAADHPNCPVENGPDVDFGAGIMLVPLPSGHDLIVAGQKNGWLFGLDPDERGRVVWKTRIGRGGIQGGIHFGMAADGTRIYAGISDMKDEHTGRTSKETPRPGINAIDAATGKILWTTPANDVCAGRQFCDSGISAAVTAIPGAVFAGHMDGRFRAYDGATGAVLKEFDTTQNVRTTSGTTAHGGSFGGPGAAVRDGYVVVNSGYGIYFHMPGNVLLAYRAQ